MSTQQIPATIILNLVGLVKFYGNRLPSPERPQSATCSSFNSSFLQDSQLQYPTDIFLWTCVPSSRKNGGLLKKGVVTWGPGPSDQEVSLLALAWWARAKGTYQIQWGDPFRTKGEWRAVKDHLCHGLGLGTWWGSRWSSFSWWCPRSHMRRCHMPGRT